MRDLTRPQERVISTTTKVIDKQNGLIHAVVSTENKDRDGDIIRAEGWDLSHFRENPVLLSSHNYGSLRSIIGRWESMDVDRKKRLVGTARYFVGEGNEEADWGFNLAAKGMAAFSVGFIPDMSQAKRLGASEDDELWPNFEFRGQELLEVSHVTIPSNRQALQQVKSLGSSQLLHPAILDVVNHMLTKTTVRKQPDDVFDNPEDAEARAEELGCEGYHEMEADGETVYMPCRTHEAYEDHLGRADNEEEETASKRIKAHGGAHDHEDDGSHEHDEYKALESRLLIVEADINKIALELIRNATQQALKEGLRHGIN